MSLSLVLGIGLIVAGFCLFDATRWLRRTPLTASKFFLYDGNFTPGWFAVAASAANLSLGNFIIFIANWGYRFGLAGLIVFALNILLNFAGFIYLLPTLKSYFEDRNNSGTVHEYIFKSYARNGDEGLARTARLFASIVTVTGLLLGIMFELSLAVNLLGPSSPQEAIFLFAALAGLIALFTAYGGFRTLFMSDAWNEGLLTLGAVCLVVLIAMNSRFASPDQILSSLSPSAFSKIGWPAALSIAVMGFGWMIVAMDQWQRACAARDAAISQRGTLGYLALALVFAAIFALWGAFDSTILPTLAPGARLSGEANPLLDIARLPSAGSLVPWLARFAVIGLVFAAVSTTNTFLNVAAHSMTSDVLVGLLARRDIHSLSPMADEQLVGFARGGIIAAVFVLTLVYAGASAIGLLSKPLNFFYIAYSVQFALLAPILFSRRAMARRPSARAAAISLAVGFLTAIAVGFGSWLLLQAGAGEMLWLSPQEWLVLAPVVTVGLGAIALILSDPRAFVGARQPQP